MSSPEDDLVFLIPPFPTQNRIQMNKVTRACVYEIVHALEKDWDASPAEDPEYEELVKIIEPIIERHRLFWTGVIID